MINERLADDDAFRQSAGRTDRGPQSAFLYAIETGPPSTRGYRVIL